MKTTITGIRPLAGVHLESTTIFRAAWVERARPRRSNIRPRPRAECPLSPPDSGLAAPEDGRAPMVISRCTPLP